MLKRFLQYLMMRLRGEISTQKLISLGMVVGKNFQRMSGCSLDISHCWLIRIGDNVTFAPNVKLIAHDAATKAICKHVRIGKILIGDNVFIGNSAIVLPGVTIGNDVVIGSGAVVANNIPNNSVAVGNPARVICTYQDYSDRINDQFSYSPIFDERYTLRKKISRTRRNEMLLKMKGIYGFVK